jgi:beta-glucosidase
MTFGRTPTSRPSSSGPTSAASRRAAGPDSVAHDHSNFPGGGPQRDVEDPHFAHGREQVYPGGRQEYHLAPFGPRWRRGRRRSCPTTDAVRDGVGGGRFAFNRPSSRACCAASSVSMAASATDWGSSPTVLRRRAHAGPSLGPRGADPAERVARALEAASTSRGGESCPELLVSWSEPDRPRGTAGRLGPPLLHEKSSSVSVDAEPLTSTRARDHRPDDFVAAGRQPSGLDHPADRGRPKGPPPCRWRQTWPLRRGLRNDAAAGWVGSSTTRRRRRRRPAAGLPLRPRPGRFESMFHAGPWPFPPRSGTAAAVCARGAHRVDLYGTGRPSCELAVAAAPCWSTTAPPRRVVTCSPVRHRRVAGCRSTAVSSRPSRPAAAMSPSTRHPALPLRDGLQD